MSRRAALVTGGSRGIGLAVAAMLGAEGYDLTIVAEIEREVEAAVETLHGEGARAHGVVADLTDEQDVVGMTAAHEDAWGRLDVLVNNAGAGLTGPVGEIETGDLDRLLALNLRAVALATREGLPMLRRAGAEHGEALIVNMASISGTKGLPNISVYGATKRAVIVLSRSTQREVAGAGVRCTALAPSLVASAMTESVQGRFPPEAMIPATDVAEAVRFLLRTSASCLVPEIVLASPGR